MLNPVCMTFNANSTFSDQTLIKADVDLIAGAFMDGLFALHRT